MTNYSEIPINSFTVLVKLKTLKRNSWLSFEANAKCLPGYSIQFKDLFVKNTYYIKQY